MKKLLTSYILLIVVMASYGQTITEPPVQKASTYFFIRHAEKDRSDSANKNPMLNMNGILRAAKWSLVFDNVKFDAVYSTDYNRTIQTAQPTAEKNDISVTLYDPSTIDIQAFLKETKGKTVLIVGHSNTTPILVNEIIKKDKYPQIKDNNNSNLYIVSISQLGELTDTLLVID